MMRLFKNIYSLLAAVALACALPSCQDTYFEGFDTPDGDGAAEVSITIACNNFYGADLQSRGTAGDAIKEFERSALNIVIYSKDDEGDGYTLHSIVNGADLDSYNYNSTGNTTSVTHEGWGTEQAESATPQATFKLKQKLPYGTYKIYAVANVALPASTEINTPDKLESYRVDWVSPVKSNNAMMGMMSTNEEEIANGPVTISSDNIALHAWLVRCASKVTVAYNTDNLNEQTWIYLKRVTIKDIPTTCSLGAFSGNHVTETSRADNSCALTNGESIWYDPTPSASYDDFETWPTLTRATGTWGSDHSETAEALYFYENNQGTGDLKWQDFDDDGNVQYPTGGETDSDGNFTDEHRKDRKYYGTYVEVEAYYRSYANGNQGEGKIIYRFMLGMDADTDYNARRNHHFKLTLMFRGNANDVDWHIDYDQDTTNPIYTPQPFYISYQYGEKVEMPITINGELMPGSKVTAEIVENNWRPMDAPDSEYWPGEVWTDDNHKYEGPWLGFLSLRPTNYNRDFVGRNPGKGNAATDGFKGYLMSYWYGGSDKAPGLGLSYTSADIQDIEGMYVPPQGYREYGIDNLGVVQDNTKDNVDSYNFTVTTNGDQKTTRLNIPLYTRALFLVKALGYSGANTSFFHQRKAVVKITATMKDGRKVSKLCDVVQVRRLINPCGVYRAAGDNSPFEVILNFRNSEKATTFAPFASEGRWSAEIESTSHPNFINLNGKTKIYGSTGTVVDFTINITPDPMHTSNENRYAVVLIKYHDYTCVHRVMVRQGYEPDIILDDVDIPADSYYSGSSPNVKWHAFNLRGGGYECKSPIEEGSLFKIGNLDTCIDARENVRADIALPVESTRKFAVVSKKGKLVKNTSSKAKTWNDIKILNPAYSTWAETQNTENSGTNAFSKWVTLYDDAGNAISSGKSRLPNHHDWASLRNSDIIGYHFGVCYDGNTQMTSMASDDAFNYNYYNADNVGKGMVGAFVFNKKNGRNIFLPAGSSRMNRRRHRDSQHGGYSTPGTLLYATRDVYMPDAIVKFMPQFWTIKDNSGVVYWGFLDRQERTNVWDGNPSSGFCAWDINISTYDFNIITKDNILKVETNNVTASSACPIRLVDP